MTEPMGVKLKLCKDCKWCSMGFSGPRFAGCSNPRNKRTDPVSGETILRYNYCSSLRDEPGAIAQAINICGENGAWWEPR